jgi:hypothetical protein
MYYESNNIIYMVTNTDALTNTQKHGSNTHAGM